MTKTKSPERRVLRRGDLRVARVMAFHRWTIGREMCCVRELDARECMDVLNDCIDYERGGKYLKCQPKLTDNSNFGRSGRCGRRYA